MTQPYHSLAYAQMTTYPAVQYFSAIRTAVLRTIMRKWTLVTLQIFILYNSVAGLWGG